MYFMIHKHHTKTNQQPPPYSFAHDTRRSGTPQASTFLPVSIRYFGNFENYTYMYPPPRPLIGGPGAGRASDATNSSGLD
jgi:hypothetical protein